MSGHDGFATTGTSGSVYTCALCGHNWVSRKDNGVPKSCPKCRSTVWNKDYHVCECVRCGYKWGSTHERPSRCPGCHTTKWDVPEDSAGRKKHRRPARVSVTPDKAEEINCLYDAGENITAIARHTGLSFCKVFSVISDSRPKEQLNI